MRNVYNAGGVSGAGGVSDCAGLQSIGAAITSAATGNKKIMHFYIIPSEMVFNICTIYIQMDLPKINKHILLQLATHKII